MKGSFAISLLLGAAMYAAIGLFGVVVFHDAGPVTQAVSDGYGIGDSTIATANAPTGDTAKRVLVR